MNGSDEPLRVALTTLGCKVNYAEMAELAGRLSAAGLEIVEENRAADVRVLNSCGVTLHADATTRQRISRLRRGDPNCHLIVTGCSVDANLEQFGITTGATDASLPRGVDAVFRNSEKGNIADYVIALAAQATAPNGAVAGAKPALLLIHRVIGREVF